MKLPSAVKYLLISNIVVFIIQAIVANRAMLPIGEDSLTSNLSLYYFGKDAFKPFQLVTYMFLHGNFMHLFFNMFALWMFGRIIEMTWGSKQFLIYYLVCGIGAGLTQEICQALGFIDIDAFTLGASGAVFGLLLAFGMSFPNERIFIIPIPFPIKAKYFVMGYAAIEILQSLGERDGVAHMAHLGGMAFGLLLILYWRHKKNVGKDINSWKRNHLEENSSSNNIFGWGSRQATSTAGTYTTYEEVSNTNSDYAYNAKKRAESEKIDAILDKIRQWGYESLSDDEKKTLFDASSRMSKQR